MGQEMTTIQRRFAVAGTARLTLRNVKGEIDIQPGAEGQIEVTAVKHPGRGFDRTEVEITQAEDGSVTAATKYEDDLVGRLLGFGGNEPCRVDYTVRLPATACAVDLATVSGPVSMAGLTGEFKLRSVSGAQRLSGLTGKLKVDTVSGEMTGAGLRLTEPLDLSTVSGDVNLTECHLPGVEASTVSGRLRLEMGAAAGSYRFKSVSGDVHLQLPAGTPCAVSVHTISGRLRSALPASQADEHNTAEGGARVRFNSVSGDLNLLSDLPNPPAPETEEEAAAPVVEPTGPRTAAERLELLEKVSRGELSVDDALSSLQPNPSAPIPAPDVRTREGEA